MIEKIEILKLATSIGVPVSTVETERDHLSTKILTKCLI